MKRLCCIKVDQRVINFCTLQRKIMLAFNIGVAVPVTA